MEIDFVLTESEPFPGSNPTRSQPGKSNLINNSPLKNLILNKLKIKKNI